MSAGSAFDLTLCALLLGVAVWTVAGGDRYASVISFVVYGLLLGTVWVRLGAPDVALAEAAIGAGLTGLLLLNAVARTARAGEEPPRPSRAVHAFALGACGAVGLGLGWVVLQLAGVSAGLQTAVETSLGRSGVKNPVTAVLLNFRGYDTLIESLVLLAALLGIWSLTADEAWGRRAGMRQHVRPHGVLAVFGRLLPPLGIVIGGYVAWVGSSAPGGAFQAGTVLAAVWLLAILAGVVEAPRISSRALRLSVVIGPGMFVAAGAAGLAAGGPFLGLPAGLAEPLILAVEAGLTLSIAATLALLVVGPPVRS